MSEKNDFSGGPQVVTRLDTPTQLSYERNDRTSHWDWGEPSVFLQMQKMMCFDGISMVDK
jgi:hypothetical protein